MPFGVEECEGDRHSHRGCDAVQSFMVFPWFDEQTCRGDDVQCNRPHGSSVDWF